MLPLTLIIHIFVGSTLAGCAVIALLVMGYGSLLSILIAALAGYVVGLPVSAMIAKQIA